MQRLRPSRERLIPNRGLTTKSKQTWHPLWVIQIIVDILFIVGAALAIASFVRTDMLSETDSMVFARLATVETQLSQNNTNNNTAIEADIAAIEAKSQGLMDNITLIQTELDTLVMPGDVTMLEMRVDTTETAITTLQNKDMTLMNQISTIDGDISMLTSSQTTQDNSITTLTSNLSTETMARIAQDDVLAAQIMNLTIKDMLLMNADALQDARIDAIVSLGEMLSNETMSFNQTILDALVELMSLDSRLDAEESKSSTFMTDIMTLQGSTINTLNSMFGSLNNVDLNVAGNLVQTFGTSSITFGLELTNTDDNLALSPTPSGLNINLANGVNLTALNQKAQDNMMSIISLQSSTVQSIGADTGGATTGTSVTLIGGDGIQTTRSGNAIRIELSTPQSESIVYMNSDTGNDLNNGETVGSPVKTIQTAINRMEMQDPADLCTINLAGSAVYDFGTNVDLNLRRIMQRCETLRFVGTRQDEIFDTTDGTNGGLFTTGVFAYFGLTTGSLGAVDSYKDSFVQDLRTNDVYSVASNTAGRFQPVTYADLAQAIYKHRFDGVSAATASDVLVNTIAGIPLVFFRAGTTVELMGFLNLQYDRGAVLFENINFNSMNFTSGGGIIGPNHRRAALQFKGCRIKPRPFYSLRGSIYFEGVYLAGLGFEGGYEASLSDSLDIFSATGELLRYRGGYLSILAGVFDNVIIEGTNLVFERLVGQLLLDSGANARGGRFSVTAGVQTPVYVNTGSTLDLDFAIMGLFPRVELGSTLRIGELTLADDGVGFFGGLVRDSTVIIQSLSGYSARNTMTYVEGHSRLSIVYVGSTVTNFNCKQLAIIRDSSVLIMGSFNIADTYNTLAPDQAMFYAEDGGGIVIDNRIIVLDGTNIPINTPSALALAGDRPIFKLNGGSLTVVRNSITTNTFSTTGSAPLIDASGDGNTVLGRNIVGNLANGGGGNVIVCGSTSSVTWPSTIISGATWCAR